MLANESNEIIEEEQQEEYILLNRFPEYEINRVSFLAFIKNSSSQMLKKIS